MPTLSNGYSWDFSTWSRPPCQAIFFRLLMQRHSREQIAPLCCKGFHGYFISTARRYNHSIMPVPWVLLHIVSGFIKYRIFKLPNFKLLSRLFLATASANLWP